MDHDPLLDRVVHIEKQPDHEQNDPGPVSDQVGQVSPEVVLLGLGRMHPFPGCEEGDQHEQGKEHGHEVHGLAVSLLLVNDGQLLGLQVGLPLHDKGVFLPPFDGKALAVRRLVLLFREARIIPGEQGDPVLGFDVHVFHVPGCRNPHPELFGLQLFNGYARVNVAVIGHKEEQGPLHQHPPCKGTDHPKGAQRGPFFVVSGHDRHQRAIGDVVGRVDEGKEDIGHIGIDDLAAGA